ncbi:MAG TPA: PEP-CTERM sorting domain-containing protein [Vicinamibacterales bacterium]|nr:PEP-CTERM sorting domain-containing protein [Vicinamibacterales bacterium]
MLKQVKKIAIAMFAVAGLAAPASAATVIDFATGFGTGSGGQVYMIGSDYIGQNIPIGRLLVDGAPNSGEFVVRGTATGTSGTFGTRSIFGDLDFNTATHQISITGCVPELGVGGSGTGSAPCANPVVLLSGTITGFSDPFGTNNFIAVAGVDFKNPQLLAALGVDASFPFALTGSVQTGNPFGQGIQFAQPSVSTDVANTQVPEPATMMLLGTGLLAAFRARRQQTS